MGSPDVNNLGAEDFYNTICLFDHCQYSTHTHTHTHTHVFWALGVASGDLGSAEVLGYGRWVGEQKRVQVSIDVPTVPPHP